MRERRHFRTDWCYHLISRIAHRAFFLDEEERTRLVDLVRRVSRFSGVKLLAYGVMSNHFHIFVYIGHPGRIDDAEIIRIRRVRNTRPQRQGPSGLSRLPGSFSHAF